MSAKDSPWLQQYWIAAHPFPWYVPVASLLLVSPWSILSNTKIVRQMLARSPCRQSHTTTHRRETNNNTKKTRKERRRYCLTNGQTGKIGWWQKETGSVFAFRVFTVRRSTMSLSLYSIVVFGMLSRHSKQKMILQREGSVP